MNKQNRIKSLLSDERIRRARRDERWFYSPVDVIRALTDSAYAAEQWEDLKKHDGALDAAVEAVRLFGDGTETVVEMLPLSGVVRLIQSLNSGKAERIKTWIAAAAAQRIEEDDNPELALLRTRELYLRKGYSRRWIDGRVRALSARHDLASEWYRRGARTSDDFRALTNELIKSTFGMDVEQYRRYKGLTGTRHNLRDHMTDTELALTSLAEATAVTFSRERNSASIEQSIRDVKDAGRIVSQTREQIEDQLGRMISFPGNHLDSAAPSPKAA
jgi:hypothetical protein